MYLSCGWITPSRRIFPVGSNLLASAGVYARGDENNQDVNGKLPGYLLANVDARYRLSSALEIFARVNNVFDRRYFNFGVVGENFFTGPNLTFGPSAGVAAEAEQFGGPGAPRGVWLGVKYSLQRKAGATPLERDD